MLPESPVARCRQQVEQLTRQLVQRNVVMPLNDTCLQDAHARGGMSDLDYLFTCYVAILVQSRGVVATTPCPHCAGEDDPSAEPTRQCIFVRTLLGGSCGRCLWLGRGDTCDMPRQEGEEEEETGDR